MTFESKGRNMIRILSLSCLFVIPADSQAEESAEDAVRRASTAVRELVARIKHEDESRWLYARSKGGRFNVGCVGRSNSKRFLSTLAETQSLMPLNKPLLVHIEIGEKESVRVMPGKTGAHRVWVRCRKQEEVNDILRRCVESLWMTENPEETIPDEVDSGTPAAGV